jgi:outer membrane protein assembly factor BamB
VFVGSYDGRVYALNASAGAFVWSYTTGDWVVSSPAVANGMIYVGSYDHQVYAFGSSSNEQTYSVSFTASGLPSGTRWNVTLNAQTQSSTADSVVFNVPNGVYGFVITPPNEYEASPASGSITVHFADANQQVTFTSTVSDGLPLFALAILAIVLVLVLLTIVFYLRKR